MKTLLLALALLLPLAASADLSCDAECVQLIKLSRGLPVVSFNSFELYSHGLEDKAFTCRLIGRLEGETRNFSGAGSHKYVDLINASAALNELDKGLMIENLREVRDLVRNYANAYCLPKSEYSLDIVLNRLRIAESLYDDIGALITQHLRRIRK